MKPNAAPLHLALALLATFPAFAAAPAGTLRTYTIATPAVAGRARHVRVYLPPGYDDPAAAGRRYPVLYLLHGWPGSDGNWVSMGDAGTTLDREIAAGRIPASIAVFPDGRGPGLLGRSLYVDARDGSLRLEQFIVGDLVAWTDSLFRTVAEPRARALVGLSDGGTGAVRLAMLHPDVFGACASTGGTFRLVPEMGMGGVFGPGPEGERARDEASPALLAARHVDTLRGQAIAFDCGLDDPALEDNRRFDRLLDSLGVTHAYREYPGGHGWGYWRARLPELLERATARMR